MKVFILGHRGMLGSCVTRFLSKQKIDLHITTKRFPDEEFFKIVEDAEPDFVINCIGAIPQRASDFTVNSELPKQLASIFTETKTRIIHPSTDCEFSGQLIGGLSYTIFDKMDTLEPYGKSKVEGTRAAICSDRFKIIRSSIIGLDQGNYSLLGWFLSNRGKAVNGYTNHIWNGITVLEWVKVCWQIMKSPESYPDLIQLGTKPITKFQLLNIFNEVFDAGVTVFPNRAEYSVNRSLMSYDQPFTFFKKDIKDQLEEYRKFCGV